MQSFIILAITGTKKLIVTEVEGRKDGWVDRNSKSYIAHFCKQVR